MNPSPASTQVNENARYQSAAGTRLQGRWLAPLRVAWLVLSILTVLLFVASLPVYFASLLKTYTVGYAVFLVSLDIVVTLVWFIVAGLIFWRKSNDWLALLVSFMLVAQGANTTLSSLNPTPSNWQIIAAVVNILAFASLFLVFSLFPNGRFVPRWIPWLGLLFLVWDVVGNLNLFPQSYLLLFLLGWYLFLGGFVVAQLYRYSAVSSQTERQQTKWIVFGVTTTYLVEFGIALCFSIFIASIHPGSLVDLILTPLGNAAPVLIPLSFGFAILRYRLWEIDHIINRTLVYGTVTVLLAVVYFGLVIILQSIVHGLTGQVSRSPVVIVSSTLLIAALFQPLRAGIQKFIDRRFYRSKYDMAKTLEHFNAMLRDEVDLDRLQEQLMQVVEETMQPVHVSLWLHHPEASGERNTRLLPRIDD